MIIWWYRNKRAWCRNFRISKKDLQGKEVESMQMISYDIHWGGVRGIQSPGEVTETKASFVHFFPGHPTACPKSLFPDLAKDCKWQPTLGDTTETATKTMTCTCTKGTNDTYLDMINNISFLPESSKGVKFVPLNHQKQTWGWNLIPLESHGESRYTVYVCFSLLKTVCNYQQNARRTFWQASLHLGDLKTSRQQSRAAVYWCCKECASASMNTKFLHGGGDQISTSEMLWYVNTYKYMVAINIKNTFELQELHLDVKRKRLYSWAMRFSQCFIHPYTFNSSPMSHKIYDIFSFFGM